ncbi:MAG: right-handed parallel beta-helix repeat-containing protein [bacterium]
MKKITLLALGVSLAIVSSFFFYTSHTTHADTATYTVTTLADNVDDSTCTLSSCTLREAANAASATAGATINFASDVTGTITVNDSLGSITIPNSLSIVGPGASKLTISGNDLIQVIVIASADITATISGVTIAHGQSQGGSAINSSGILTVHDVTFKNNNGGAGATISSSGPSLTVTNCLFVGNTAGDGGGIIASTGTISVTGSEFLGNTASDAGGAIYATGDASLTVTDSTFDGNSTAGNGGAIDNESSNILTLVRDTFRSNMSPNGNGGAVYSVSNVQTTDGSFSNNNSNGSGGAIATNGSSVSTDGTDFTSNVASNDNGGAIYVNGSGLGLGSSIIGGTFSGNLSHGCNGGAIYGTATSAFSISNARFMRNMAVCAGGALFIADNSTISGSTFEGNRASTNGGAIKYSNGTTHTIESSSFTNNTADSNGGAIFQASGSLSVSVNTTFTGNSIGMHTGGTGGAIDAEGGSLSLAETTFSDNHANLYGCGGAVSTYSDTTIHDSTFTNNHGLAGGAMCIFNGRTVTIDDSSFTRNMANDDAGGAIYHDGGDLTIQNSIFNENQVNDGNQGGAILAGGNSLTISGTAFTHNASRGNAGGAIYSSEQMISIAQSSFVGNTAFGGNGGALFLTGATSASVSDTTFSQNSATNGGAVSTGVSVGFTNTTFDNNSAILTAGSVYVVGGTVSAQSSIFSRGLPTNCNAALHTSGHNIETGTDCGLLDASDKQSTSPHLDPEGPKISTTGPTLGGLHYLYTVALTSSSTDAIDAGASCSSADERGVARIGTCDIGAYEYDASNPQSIATPIVYNTPTIIVTRFDDPVGGTCVSGTDCSLRQAVAFATSGETIGFDSSHLGTFTLTSPIVVDKTIQISGLGENLTTLSGGGNSQIFSVTSDGNLSLNNLTIADGNGGSGDAGAIDVVGPITTDFVTFRNNIAPNGEGGAVYGECDVVGRTIAFTNTMFEGNFALTGGAVYNCGTTSDLNMLTTANDIFVNNYASTGSGGAIYTMNSSLGVTSSLLISNSSGNEGGAVYVTATSVEPVITVSNSELINNWSYNGGGGLSNGLSALVHIHLTGGTIFRGNVAEHNPGGAFNLNSAYLDEISNVTFTGNQSSTSYGGAASLFGLLNTAVVFDAVHFDSNFSSSVGGGLLIYTSANVTMQNGTEFTGNNSGNNTPAGAAYIHANSLAIANAEFTYNTSWGESGGALFVDNTPYTIDQSTFTGNKSVNGNGGVLYASNNGDAESGTITRSIFDGNMTVGGTGGAIMVTRGSGSTTVTDSTFLNNYTYDGGDGAIHSEGTGLTVAGSSFLGNGAYDVAVGAVGHYAGNLSISGTTFAYNSTVGYAGAVYDQSNGTSTVKNSTFYRNFAPVDEAGGYYHDGSSALTINNTTFAENVSNSEGGSGLFTYAPTVVTNSIFAGSPLASCHDTGSHIDAVNSMYNVDDASGCFDAENHNQNNVNGATVFSSSGLAANGGNTLTLALAMHSPAIDAGSDTTCETTDQTGRTRAGNGVACDAGAVESHYDVVTETPTLASPTNGASYARTDSISVSFNLPETPYANSIVLTFAPSSGDPIVIHLRDAEPNRLNTFSLPISSGITTGVTEVVSATADSIPAGTYTVTLSYRDANNNPQASASATGVVVAGAVTHGGGGGGGGGILLTNKTDTTQTITPPVAQVVTPVKQVVAEKTVVATGLPAGFQFTKNLKPQMSNKDIVMLQIFLNANGFTVTKNGQGSKGNESPYFGAKTKLALIKFQEAYAKDILVPQGLTKGTGNLGTFTRKVLNAWIAGAQKATQ